MWWLKLERKLLYTSITYLSALSTIAIADNNNGTSKRNNSDETCLLRSVCKNTVNGVTRNSPCHYGNFAPFINVTDDDFYELLWTHCPHFFDDKDELAHPICCSAEQEDSIAKLIGQVDIIRRSCPSCTINAKKYFCNLFCLPNQAQTINVEKQLQNHAAVNVTYVISEQFARTFFDSCYDVKIFGAYLMDQSYICGPHKRENCTPTRFLTTLGSIAQMPLVVTPLIASDDVVTISGKQFTPMIGKVYHCDEAPPDEAKCTCDQCSRRCNETISSKTSRKMSLDPTSKNEEKSGAVPMNRRDLPVHTLVWLMLFTISQYSFI